MYKCSEIKQLQKITIKLTAFVLMEGRFGFKGLIVISCMYYHTQWGNVASALAQGAYWPML